jgi:hypothetical protein
VLNGAVRAPAAAAADDLVGALAAAAAAVLLLLVVMPVSTMLPGLTGNSAWNNGCHRGSVEALCLKAVQVQVSAARGRAWGGEAHRP